MYHSRAEGPRGRRTVPGRGPRQEVRFLHGPVVPRVQEQFAMPCLGKACPCQPHHGHAVCARSLPAGGTGTHSEVHRQEAIRSTRPLRATRMRCRVLTLKCSAGGSEEAKSAVSVDAAQNHSNAFQQLPAAAWSLCTLTQDREAAPVLLCAIMCSAEVRLLQRKGPEAGTPGPVQAWSGDADTRARGGTWSPVLLRSCRCDRELLGSLSLTPTCGCASWNLRQPFKSVGPGYSGGSADG